MRYKSIYCIINLLDNKQEYIYFVPDYNKNKTKQNSELKKIYKNPDVLSKIKSTDKVLDFNIDMMTIDEIKIIIAYNLSINLYDFYLCGTRSKLNIKEQNESLERKRKFNEPIFNDIILDFKYTSVFGDRSLPGNFLHMVDKKLDVNSLDVIVNTSKHILSNYNLKQNCIIVRNKNDVLSLVNTDYDRYIDDILTIYFPFKNPYNEEEYKLFIDEKIEQINVLNKKYNTSIVIGYDKQLELESFRIQNLIMTIDPFRQSDIDLENIFKNLELDEKIFGVHYYDVLKNNLYRVNKEILFPNLTKSNYDTYSKINKSLKTLRLELSIKHNVIKSIKKGYSADKPISANDLMKINKLNQEIQHLFSEIKILDSQKHKLGNATNIDFNDSNLYSVEYLKGKYNPVINKKTLLNWKRNIFLPCEDDIKNRIKGSETLTLKLNYRTNDDYLIIVTLLISRFGEVHLKLTDMISTYLIERVDIANIIRLSNGVIAKLNLLTINKIRQIQYNINSQIVNLDFINDISLNDGESFETIKNKLKLSTLYGLYVENNVNVVSFKFLRTNNGYDIINAKKYFFMIKRSLKQVGVKQLRNIWVSEAARIFNLSRIEAFNILETLGEEIETDDFKNDSMMNVIELIFTKGDRGNNIVVSGMNISNNMFLDNVNSFLEQVINLTEADYSKIYGPTNSHSSNIAKSKSKSTSSSPSSSIPPKKMTPPVILTTAIQKQNFVNDDNLELDIDYDDSDSDSDSDDDDDGADDGEGKTNPKTGENAPKMPPIENPKTSEKSNATKKSPAESTKPSNLLITETKKTLNKSLPKNIREYMINMRKERDTRLFVFKKSKMFDSYSSKCGAVDMRQPILVNDFEIENMLRNPYSKSAYEQSKDSHLMWGSSSSNLNTYMCPRVWCIKDNVEIRPIDLVRNNGKCPICNGEIIDPKEKTIAKNNTVLLRRGKSNNYWGDTEVPEDYLLDIDIYKNDVVPLKKSINELEDNHMLNKTERNSRLKVMKASLTEMENTKDRNGYSINDYKKLWNTYLQGTEKLAHPSFLKNKTHPEDLCMPCCNANLKKIDTVYRGDNSTIIKAIPNYDRCLKQHINGLVEVSKTTLTNSDFKDFKPGYLLTMNIASIINKQLEQITHEKELELNNYILVRNKKDEDKCLLIKVTMDGGEIQTKFTNTNIPFINGITFIVTELNLQFLSYKRVKDNTNYFYTKLLSSNFNKIKDDKINYIMGKDKFHLPNGKLGVLVDKVDKLLNLNVTSIIKGAINYDKYKIEAKSEHIDKYKSLINQFLKEVNVKSIGVEQFIEKREDYLQEFYREIGTPDKEHIKEHKKKAYLSVETGEIMDSNKRLLNFEVGDRIILNFEGFLRKGTLQNDKYSLFTVFQNIRGVDTIELFIALLFDLLTPDLFIKLNCGEIFKTFYNKNYNYNDLKNVNLFVNWCKFYDDFVSNYFPKFKSLTNESVLKILNLPNKKSLDLYLLYNIHISHENYKKYIGDLNIEKNYDLVIALLSSSIPTHIYKKYLEKHGLDIKIVFKLNVFALEYNEKRDSVNLINPPYTDLTQYYNFDENATTFIYKNGNLYENIVFSKQIYGNSIDSFMILSTQNIHIAKKMLEIMMLTNNQDSFIRIPSLLDLVNKSLKSNFDIDSLIIDRYFKGVGVIINVNDEQIFINTKSFYIQNKFIINKNIVKIRNIKYYSDKSLPKPKLSSVIHLNKLLSKLNIPYYKFDRIIVNKKNMILGIVNEYNFTIPVQPEIKSSKYNYETINEDNLDDIDFSLNKELNIIDERLDKVNSISHQINLYNLVKLSLSKFIKKFTGRIVKTMTRDISIILDNHNLPNHLKFNQIKEILTPFYDKIVTVVNSSYLSQHELCVTHNKTKCMSCKSCKYSTEKKGINVCSLKIGSENYERILNLLVNELVYFENIRKKIFLGMYISRSNIDINELDDLILDLNYERMIEELYIENNIIYINTSFINSLIQMDISVDDQLLKSGQEQYKQHRLEHTDTPETKQADASQEHKTKTKQADTSQEHKTKTKQADASQEHKTKTTSKAKSSSNSNSASDHKPNISSQNQAPTSKFDLDENQYATTRGWDGVDYSGTKNVEAGKCIYQYKVRGDKNSPYTGCNFIPKLSAQNRGKICPTKLKTNKSTWSGTIDKFGFCKKTTSVNRDSIKSSLSKSSNNAVNKESTIKNKSHRSSQNSNPPLLDDKGRIVNDVYANDRDLFGNPIPKKYPKIVPGKCIFPFKYRSKNLPLTSFPRGRVYGEEFKGKDKILEYWDCVPLTERSKDKKFGYWCPTSLKKNGMRDTYAYCKKGLQLGNESSSIPKSIKLAPVSANNNTLSKSISKITSKKKPVIQTSISESRSVSKSKAITKSSSSKVRYATNYRLNPKTLKKQYLNPKKGLSGKCVYPFKWKRNTYNYPDCPLSIDKNPFNICATTVKKSGTMDKFGVCLPENMTLEEYETNIIKEQRKLEESKSKPTKFKFTKKKITTSASSDSPKNKRKYQIKKPIKQPVKTHVKQPVQRNWLNKFYKSDKLQIIETKQNGDCFFDSVVKALGDSALSIPGLRKMVSDYVTDVQLKTYRDIYNNAVSDNDFEVIQETRFIAGIETLQDLKDYIKKSAYWADMLAVNIIERILKIKVICLSETMYTSENYSRIINCGNNLQASTISKCDICNIESGVHSELMSMNSITNDSYKIIIETCLDAHGVNYSSQSNLLKLYKSLSKDDKHHFSDEVIEPKVIPERIVLVNYEDGRHYKLIAVNGQTHFNNLNQLPDKLRENIIEKCRTIREIKYFNK